jgi:hypothetical protein
MKSCPLITRHSTLKCCDIGDQNIDRRPINMWNIEQKPWWLYLQYKFVLQEKVTQKHTSCTYKKTMNGIWIDTKS